MVRQALRSIFMAITTKTGLAPGVALSSLRPYVEKELTLPEFAPPVGGGEGTAGPADGAAPAAVAAELKAVVMQVLIDNYRVALLWLVLSYLLSFGSATYPPSS